MSRRGLRRARRPAPAEPDDPDGEDSGGTIGATSLSDLTREADPVEFDQTFSASSGDFGIGGPISSPAPYPLQVIPRIAYVLNYNLVYDSNAGKWVPQKKSEGDDGKVIVVGGGDSELRGILIAVSPDRSQTTLTPNAVDNLVIVGGNKSPTTV